MKFICEEYETRRFLLQVRTKNLMKIASFNLKVNPLTHFHRMKPNVPYHIVPAELLFFGQSKLLKILYRKKQRHLTSCEVKMASHFLNSHTEIC